MPVIKKIVRSLPLKLLKLNLAQNYKKYRKLYGNDYAIESLKHVDFYFFEKLWKFQILISKFIN